MRTSIKLRRCGILLAIAPILVWGETDGAEQKKIAVSGFLRGSYDYRGQGSYSDQDAYAYWHLRASDEQVEVYTSGRLQKDLDGTSKSYADDPYISLEDTSREDHVRLLQLYVDMHDKKKTLAARVGRQYVDVADYIQMDGLQVMLLENKTLGGRVFAGKPVSFYSSTSADLFFGASLTGKAWSGNRSRATYARYEDDSEDKADDHFFFDVRQQIYETFRTRGYLSVMNNDVRMGGLDMYYMSLEEKVLDAAAGVRRWGDFDANTRVYSPLVQTLGELEPYTTGYGRVTAQVAPALFLSPGFYMRSPDDSDATNNRYERYDLSLIFEPMAGLSTSVAMEYWDVENDESFFGVSGDIRYRYGRLWEAAAGAAYLDYTYFRFSDFSLTADGGSTIAGEDGVRVEVSPDVYTYFLRGKWNISRRFALRVAGELEDDSDEDDLAYRFRSSFEVRW